MSNCENLVMDRKPLSNAVSEALRHINEPVMTAVKIEPIEDNSSWNNMMIPSEPLQSPKYVNYYDNTCDVLKQLKMELTEEENNVVSNSGLQSDIYFKENIVLKLEDKLKTENNNTDEDLVPNGNIKGMGSDYQVTIKTEKLDGEEISNTNNNYYITIKNERLDGQELSDDVKITSSVHYDVLVKHKKVQCKWCGRSFKNSFNLLRHNIEHLKLDIDINPGRVTKKQIRRKIYKEFKTTPDGDDTRDELETYKCNYCGRSFKQPNQMHIHINTVHSTRKYYCDLCGKHFRCKQYITTHMQSIHIPEMRSDNLKCPYCDLVVKHKYNLHCHVKTLHNDVAFKCESCDAVFKCKQYLISHCKRMHYDYGRMFPCCWCDRQYRTPFHLHDHTKRVHVDLVRKQKAGVAVAKN